MSILKVISDVESINEWTN